MAVHRQFVGGVQCDGKGHAAAGSDVGSGQCIAAARLAGQRQFGNVDGVAGGEVRRRHAQYAGAGVVTDAAERRAGDIAGVTPLPVRSAATTAERRQPPNPRRRPDCQVVASSDDVPFLVASNPAVLSVLLSVSVNVVPEVISTLLVSVSV